MDALRACELVSDRFEQLIGEYLQNPLHHGTWEVLMAECLTQAGLPARLMVRAAEVHYNGATALSYLQGQPVRHEVIGVELTQPRRMVMGMQGELTQARAQQRMRQNSIGHHRLDLKWTGPWREAANDHPIRRQILADAKAVAFARRVASELIDHTLEDTTGAPDSPGRKPRL